MSFPKLLALIATLLFVIIGIAALVKSVRGSTPDKPSTEAAVLEVDLDKEIKKAHPKASKSAVPSNNQVPVVSSDNSSLPPDIDRISELFNTAGVKLPIVTTLVYKSRVPWQKGRPAWLSDYASHYSTSRHFIARSLNGKPDYFKQDIAEGDRFNVLNPDKKISFYLLIDTSRSKMWFYYLDNDTHERVLLKTYHVGLGRIDSSKLSGMLTPLGKYLLGSKIAIYKPKVMGLYNGQKIEMIRIFGTRWIPFEKEIANTTAPANGFGIHGVPWLPNDDGELAENIDSLGKYESDGCVRLATADIEELFAIIITRPTTIELVRDFHEAVLPGTEN